MIGWGYYWVTGDSPQGIGLSGVSQSAFGSAGSRHPRLMAEKPKPEFPTPMAVTRHLKMPLTFAPLHRP
jgi:hypothetical protein